MTASLLTASASRPRTVVVLSIALFASGLAHAQTGPTAPAAAAAAPAAAPVSSSDIVQLNPFEVTEASDNSYGAVNSNALTAFKTDLNRLPVSADVFNETMMSDVQAVTVEQLISDYSAGAGISSPDAGGSAANAQFLDRNAGAGLSLRGLAAPSTEINGFIPVGGGVNASGVTNIFNIERVEVIKGPQALLYGVGGAGGVVNEVTKQARFNKAAFGSFRFQVDQYGHKLGTLDYGAGGPKLAVRVAVTDQTIGDRRVNYGGPFEGAYVQIAAQIIPKTILRLNVEETRIMRENANNGTLALTALNSTNDVRNGQTLHWLLATNQIQAAANGGASGAGVIDNGNLNWSNIDTLGGAYSGEFQRHELASLVAESSWNSWLSTQIGVAYDREERWKIGNSGIAFDAPNVTANPTGTFAVASGSSATGDLWEPVREKVLRISALATNDFFGGRVHSQSVVGGDYSRSDGATITYNFVQADSNFVPVAGVPTTTNGYVIQPTIYWPVGNGPVQQPYWGPLAMRVTYPGNGLNYVRAVTNDTQPGLMSPSNPEGLSGHGSGDFRHNTTELAGIYAANYSDFFDHRLNTLLGARAGRNFSFTTVEASAPNPPSILRSSGAKFITYNTGANYEVFPWLRPYVEVSDSFNPNGGGAANPYGASQKNAQGVGQEVGIKSANADNSLSGSIALYHSKSKNEIFQFTSTVVTDINPSGLNGQFGAPSNQVNIDRETQGGELNVTASPNRDWRLRFSAATTKSTTSSNVQFAQLYNDQFYANSQGQVTYADGTVVYVPPTFNSKVPAAYTASNAPAGSVPLTIATLNTATLPSGLGNPYYANPLAVTGQITASSAAGVVLKSSDPTHGPILTGATGLPISSLQIAPNPTAPPPGAIVIARPGEITPGYSKLSITANAVYTFHSGPVSGLMLGGTARLGWWNSDYYYFANGLANPNTGRTLYNLPTRALFNGIIGYRHKLRRYLVSTQLNIDNMFNHYHVVLLPNSNSGYAGPNNATFDTAPRDYVWSTTIGF